MKHCSRRLMALLLSAILCVQLLPAMVRAEEGTAAASEGKGAFGLPAATGLTAGSTEYNSAVADAPFGSSGRAVPLFVKSELMLSYSWGGAPLYSHTYDYNGDGSEAGNLMGAFPNLANQYRVTFNSLTVSNSKQASYRVAATDGVNTGSGRQEHIAMIGLSAAGIELSLRDRNNNAVHTSTVSSGNRSWINRLAFELGGFAAIACGDFDGDGVDSVVVYVPPTQGNGDAKLMEYTISGKGSGLTLTEGVEIGNVYELLGVNTLIADHIQNVPVVQLTAADTDKDGYDELVITAGLNDTNGYILVQNLGTQVFLYDRLEDGWKQTFKYAPSAGNETVAVGDVSAASKKHRYVWGSSSVGNVLASDDSSNGTDFPEIVTAGMIDYTGTHNITINNRNFGFSMVRCVGMTEVWTGVQKNFQGEYKFLHRQTDATNKLTTHGLYSGDEVLSPLIVKCFRYQGGAQPDAVFFSGSVYAWDDNSGSGSLAHKYTHGAFTQTDKYIGSTKITNKQVQAVAVGNFDGNGEGREQVVFASLVKQSGTGNHYSTLYTIDCQPKSDNSGYEFRHSETKGWFISKQSGAYVCLTDFNYDSDSTLVRYVGVERQWTDYDVLAVLEAVPYFEELGDDLGEGRTAYGKSSSSGSGSGKSHGLNTTVLVGYEVEVENSGAGFETTIENNFTWATNVSRSIEHSVDYENNSGENAVVVYRVPVAFRPVEYTVSWTAEHGTVTADRYSGSAASIRGGTQVTFTAAPHNGYVFDHWTIDGETLTNETATLRWTVPTGQEATMEYAIEAVFTENTTTYSVTYDASGGGTITAKGHEASPATVTYGQSITFTAVPAEYGYVKEWRVDGVSVPNSSNKTSYTLENVTQAHTVTVVFATAVRYDVSYAVNGVGGTLSAAADGTELALSAGRQASVAGGSRLVFAAVPISGMMTGRWTVNGIAVTRENMSSLGVTMDHCLSNTLTIESLSRNVEVKAAFAEYSGFSIPTGGPGYEISDVKRLPADTLPDTEIRAGGDVTFTVRPAAEYSDFSKLTVNGYDCLTGSGNAAGCETVSARKNADGSYTVTLTGVTGNISADIAAHKLVIGELTVPQVLESHPDLDTADKIKLRLETMMIGTAENRAFYDIALRYKNAEGNWVEVDEANFPTGGVEVVLPYPNGTDSKDTFTIVHMLTTVARAGELELVSHTKQADGLHFRVTSLSPFGVSWVKYATPSGGGSGGSGGSGGGIFNPAYNIMVERTMNGSITVSPSSAAKGSTVTIMVYPDRGYELEMLMVMDKKGSELDLRKWGGEYSFIMPAGDVTVRARFVEEAPTQSFADVSTDAYYYEAVKWAAKNGITGGVGNGLFAPDAPCTRAQIVTFLWRAAGSPEPKNASSFSDVPASAYYARSVAWAVENGITTGTGNGRFSPDATCTRAQSVTFLYRALSARAEGTAEFRDVPKNAYYADAVAWAAANGITTGIGGGLFGPDNDCTRAQIVTFLFRTYNK